MGLGCVVTVHACAVRWEGVVPKRSDEMTPMGIWISDDSACAAWWEGGSQNEVVSNHACAERWEGGSQNNSVR